VRFPLAIAAALLACAVQAQEAYPSRQAAKHFTVKIGSDQLLLGPAGMRRFRHPSNSTEGDMR